MMPVKNMQEHLEMWTLTFRNQARSVLTDASNLFPWYQPGTSQHKLHLVGQLKPGHTVQQKHLRSSKGKAVRSVVWTRALSHETHQSRFVFAITFTIPLLTVLCINYISICGVCEKISYHLHFACLHFYFKTKKNLPKGTICTLIKYILSYAGVHNQTIRSALIFSS